MSLLPIIAEASFALVYQPLVDFYGAETLMRFYLPDGTLGFPNGIYSDLEEDGTIRQVGSGF